MSHRSVSRTEAVRWCVGWIAIAAAALAPLAGCDRAPSAVTAERRRTWEKELLAERAAKDGEFKTSPTSPMAGVARFTVRRPEKGWVVAGPAGLRVVTEPIAGSRLEFSYDTVWRWAGTPERAWREGEAAAIAPGTVPEGALFRVGRFTLATYGGAEQLVVIVFDPEREEVRDFARLRYFAPDPGFVVTARVEPVVPPEPVTLATSRNLEKRYVRWARLRFSLAGQECVLVAFKPRADDPKDTVLFVPFADRTSGSETYGSGRFLEIGEPASDRVDIDFNRAFSPLCNYSPAYNCPLPPAENRLDVAIRAGERTYPHR